MKAVGACSSIALCGFALSGCVGTTGSDLVTFDAAAAGPPDAVAGEPYAFTSGRGYAVTLTRATLHVGAIYLNRARAISGEQATGCILPGIYVAQVTEGIDVDVLSPSPQPFPRRGEGTADRAIVGEVWLNHGNVDAPDDAGVVLDVAGTAEKDGAAYPFEGTITIGQNRAIPVTDPALPSQHPICKERIVSPIDVDLRPKDGGSLLLRVDPRGLFANVDFAKLDQASASPLLYRFRDASEGQPSINLYRGMRATSGVYQFVWTDPETP